MTLLNSKFDVTSRDPHPNALAGLVIILDVADAPARDEYGTPTAGDIEPGHIVEMDTNGEAILAQGPVIGSAAPKLFAITVDGDVDHDGAAAHRITCIVGGGQFKTDKYVSTSYTISAPLAVGTSSNAGLLIPWTAATQQVYGYVGPEGLNTTTSLLDVIIPQGRG